MMRWRWALFCRCLRASYIHNIGREGLVSGLICQKRGERKSQKKTYAGNLDGSGEMARARYLRLCPVKARQDLSSFRRQSCKDFGSLAAHAHQADAALWVILEDVIRDYVDAVGLGFETGGLEVAIS